MHTRFRLVPKWPNLEDFERPKRHSSSNEKKYAAHQKNFNEDRFLLSAAKCRPMILLSRNIKYMQIILQGSSGGALIVKRL